MCGFFSCIVMKNKSVFWEAGLNGHHEILEKNKIKDNTSDQSKMRFARVEILPPSGNEGVFEKDLDLWHLRVDERITPEWFSPAHKEAAFKALEECLTVCLLDGVEVDEIKGQKGLFVRNTTIRRLRDSTVKAYDSSTVEAYGSSTVTAYDSSTVKAYGSSTVTAYDSSTVKAYDSSTVKAYGSSTVEAYGSSTAVIFSERVVFEILSKMAVAVCRFAGKVICKMMDEA